MAACSRIVRGDPLIGTDADGAPESGNFNILKRKKKKRKLPDSIHPVSVDSFNRTGARVQHNFFKTCSQNFYTHQNMEEVY